MAALALAWSISVLSSSLGGGWVGCAGRRGRCAGRPRLVPLTVWSAVLVACALGADVGLLTAATRTNGDDDDRGLVWGVALVAAAGAGMVLEGWYAEYAMVTRAPDLGFPARGTAVTIACAVAGGVAATAGMALAGRVMVLGLLVIADAVTAGCAGVVLAKLAHWDAPVRVRLSDAAIRASAAPMVVDFVASDALPAGFGSLGMSACPGRYKPPGVVRDLAVDVAHLSGSLGVDVLVTLVPVDELRRMGLQDLGDVAQRAGLVWEGSVTWRDKWVPTLADLALAAETIAVHLAAGRRVVVHCNGGKGRTGLAVAATLLTCARASADSALSLDDALSAMRAERLGMLRNPVQIAAVLAFTSRLHALPTPGLHMAGRS
ncbi:dual specificity protein phosphatase [Thecamonas trahens ATCC 50062]|uniref:Dual specificity protein phosphatase n=1 Tax=Thecamonas trahens ATCC 50062 TaxID=461836 RepID=A0A0L0DD75_THETB|nr:dual specificity protein phosphatase [Thecamonas trahens ATCC 50062]KNC49278.1 dual specificity protein phosphatase [Thecamonas trahens ATCC 50062]|eukprot:XP_013757992.1 dual specificity protein phosphatase [Thecamonas trahens ATCC 50062]